MDVCSALGNQDMRQSGMCSFFCSCHLKPTSCENNCPSLAAVDPAGQSVIPLTSQMDHTKGTALSLVPVPVSQLFRDGLRLIRNQPTAWLRGKGLSLHVKWSWKVDQSSSAALSSAALAWKSTISEQRVLRRIWDCERNLSYFNSLTTIRSVQSWIWGLKHTALPHCIALGIRYSSLC